MFTGGVDGSLGVEAPRTIDGGELLILVRLAGVEVDAETAEPTAVQPSGKEELIQPVALLYQIGFVELVEIPFKSTVSVALELQLTWSSLLYKTAPPACETPTTCSNPALSFRLKDSLDTQTCPQLAAEPTASSIS